MNNIPILSLGLIVTLVNSSIESNSLNKYFPFGDNKLSYRLEQSLSQDKYLFDIDEQHFISFLINFVNSQKYPEMEIENCVSENLSKYYDEDIFLELM